MANREEVPTTFKAKVPYIPETPNAFDLVSMAFDGPYEKVARAQALTWELRYILNKLEPGASPDIESEMFMLELSSHVVYDLLDDVLGDLEEYLRQLPVPVTMFEVAERSNPYVVRLPKA